MGFADRLFAPRGKRHSVSGNAAMAVLDAMGLLGDDDPFVHESLVGTRLEGRIVRRTQVGEYPAIVPEIDGEAWITGEHRFLMHDDDPFREGLPPAPGASAR